MLHQLVRDKTVKNSVSLITEILKIPVIINDAQRTSARPYNRAKLIDRVRVLFINWCRFGHVQP